MDSLAERILTALFWVSWVYAVIGTIMVFVLHREHRGFGTWSPRDYLLAWCFGPAMAVLVIVGQLRQRLGNGKR